MGEEYSLDAVISTPPDIFKPHTNVSVAILIFTRTEGGGTNEVRFCDMQALHDGDTAVGETPHCHTTVSRTDIAANDYQLNANLYREFVYDPPEYDPPEVIPDEPERLEDEIRRSLAELRAMLP